MRIQPIVALWAVFVGCIFGQNTAKQVRYQQQSTRSTPYLVFVKRTTNHCWHWELTPGLLVLWQLPPKNTRPRHLVYVSVLFVTLLAVVSRENLLVYLVIVRFPTKLGLVCAVVTCMDQMTLRVSHGHPSYIQIRLYVLSFPVPYSHTTPMSYPIVIRD